MISIKGIESVTLKLKSIPFNGDAATIYIYTLKTKADYTFVFSATTDKALFESYGRKNSVYDRIVEQIGMSDKVYFDLVDSFGLAAVQSQCSIEAKNQPVELVNGLIAIHQDGESDQRLHLFYKLIKGRIKTPVVFQGTFESIVVKYDLANKEKWTFSNDGLPGGSSFGKHPSGFWFVATKPERGTINFNITIRRGMLASMVNTGDFSNERIKELLFEVIGFSEATVILAYRSSIEREVVNTDKASPIRLEFATPPFLLTNTLKSFVLDNINLVSIKNVPEMHISGISEKCCLGLLLDFDNPSQAVTLLEAGNRFGCNVYALRPNHTGGGYEIEQITEDNTDIRGLRNEIR